MALVMIGVLLLVASSAARGPIAQTAMVEVSGAPLPPLTIAEGETNVPDSVLVSRQLVGRAPDAVIVRSGASADLVQRAADLGVARRVPVFAVAPDTIAAVRGELARLGASSVTVVGPPDGADLGVPVVRDDGAPVGKRPAVNEPAPIVLLVKPMGAPSAGAPGAIGRPGAGRAGDTEAAVATAESCGARPVVLPVADPRSSGDAVRLLKDRPAAPVVAIGGGFGPAPQLNKRIVAARTVPELPGGGQVVFPGRRMVALYGSPGSDTLGPLGRQSLPATIARVRALADQYRRISAVPVVPAFEIIVTVASADPGYRGMYTSMIDPAQIRPWVDAARKAGIYVTLDLQPGRMDFLSQAKAYEGLLREPNVGLALDPEWRLEPNQVHLTQIGRVSPDEVNATSAWLAGIVRDAKLPQKLLVLHQFDADMLGDRMRIDTSHPELQTVLHADGHGVPSVKMGTWNRMVSGLPGGIWMGWKNFYTEDQPMFSPAQTLAVRPQPWFVSYQ